MPVFQVGDVIREKNHGHNLIRGKILSVGESPTTSKLGIYHIQVLQKLSDTVEDEMCLHTDEYMSENYELCPAYRKYLKLSGLYGGNKI